MLLEAVQEFLVERKYDVVLRAEHWRVGQRLIVRNPYIEENYGIRVDNGTLHAIIIEQLEHRFSIELSNPKSLDMLDEWLYHKCDPYRQYGKKL